MLGWVKYGHLGSFKSTMHSNSPAFLKVLSVSAVQKQVLCGPNLRPRQTIYNC